MEGEEGGEEGGQEGGDQGGGNGGGSGGDQGASAAADATAALKARIAKYEAADTKRAADAQAAEQAAAIERGEHETVIATLKTDKATSDAKAAKWDAHLATVTKANDEKIKGLTDTQRETIEGLGDLSPLQLQRVIAMAGGASTGDQESLSTGTHKKGGKVATPQSAKDFAKHNGIDPDWVFKNVKGVWNTPKET